MGGCRCTYRNCKVKSDGQTHMFHYPVFDKVRCHMWLTNAHKLEFLELKVSQLKNRVVCQHHFIDEYFMNFKKEKLTFEAVPTENGPFCDEGDMYDIELAQEKANMCPIVLEDIENEHLSLREKKANFSVKYGDFLTSTNEIMAPFILNIDSTPVVGNKRNEWSITTRRPGSEKANNNMYAKFLPLESHKTTPMPVVQPFSNVDNTVPNPSIPANVLLEYNNQNEGQAAEHHLISGQNESSNKVTPKKNKIRIISQKQICKPLPIMGELKPVSPSLVLQANNKVEVDIQPVQEHETKPMIQDAEVKPTVQEVNVEFEFLDKSENPMNSFAQNLESNFLPTMTHQVVANNLYTIEQQPADRAVTSLLIPQSKKSNNKSSCGTIATLVKNKIPPERVAAIEEKRKFNKLKLRDMIEFCLDELEEQDKGTDDKSKRNLSDHRNSKNMIERNKSNKNIDTDQNIVVTRSAKNMKKGNRETLNQNTLKKHLDIGNINIEKVASFLSKEPSLPSAGEYNMASIEARMRRMEDILLNKIDQNSQKIVELKHSLVTSPGETKSVSTQTLESEESYKRHLFNEISKFLSPNTNSLIYEGLFLNKYAQSSIKSVHGSSQKSSPVQELAEAVQPLKRPRRQL